MCLLEEDTVSCFSDDSLIDPDYEVKHDETSSEDSEEEEMIVQMRKRVNDKSGKRMYNMIGKNTSEQGIPSFIASQHQLNSPQVGRKKAKISQTAECSESGEDSRNSEVFPYSQSTTIQEIDPESQSEGDALNSEADPFWYSTKNQVKEIKSKKENKEKMKEFVLESQSEEDWDSEVTQNQKKKKIMMR